MRVIPLLIVTTLALSACQDVQVPTAADEIAPALTASAADAATKRYRVTVTNLTSGQPLSPGVFVTHTRKVSLFAGGTLASPGIQAIAEDGDPSVAFAALQGQAGVSGLVTTAAPVGRMGGGPFPSTLSFEIDAEPSANALSGALMLICTNDGFAGLDAVALPRGFEEAVHYAAAYDAGTEVNDELAGSIVPPCFGIGPVGGLIGGANRTPEDGVVTHHPNIVGGADLTMAHRWNGPVARVTVQRIR